MNLLKLSSMSVEDLVDVLKKASNAYYNDVPIMCDSEFDHLVELLKEVDCDNNFLKEIGAASNSPLTKVSHKIPMGSLNNVNSNEEFMKWVKTIGFTDSFVVQPKLDGVSIELLYKKGNFVQALTRGDGFQGDDVTHTIKNAKGFPKKIAEQIDLSVRCEAILLLKDKEEWGGESFSNPRNTVSGLVRRLDGKQSELITCVAFDILKNSERIVFEHEIERIAWLQQNDFNTVVSEVYETYKEVEQAFYKVGRERASFNYEIDGMVVKVNNICLQAAFGEKDNRPKWAVAWKFTPKEGSTRVLGVQYSIGPTGTITPVAQVEPIEIGGTLINNVSLCNFDEVDRLGIKIGDKVCVVRSGDVIPKITTLLEPGGERIDINCTTCPSCNSVTIKDGAILHCGTPDECYETQFRKVLNWINKRNIMFFGETYVKKIFSNLLQAGCLPSVVDLYKLNQQDFKNTKIGKVMATKILAEINKSKKTSLANFIGSLALPLLGRREAQNLIDFGFNTLETFLHLTETNLLSLKGYQETKAKRIVEGIQNSRILIKELSQYLLIIDEKKETLEGVLKGKKICFTGTASKPRSVLQELVIKNGGAVKEDVSKDLDILVLSNINSTSSKALKAKQYGSTLMSENDFLKLVE